MDIIKVKNYKTFAETLETATGCDVLIKLMGNKNHVHYQLNKKGISVGVLCIDNGEATFAPFVTLENAQNCQFISMQYMPMMSDFIKVLEVFGEMFVTE